MESAGHLSAEQLITQLQTVLPPQVQLIISERGTHFTAHAFAQFAQEAGFIHLPLAGHRPQTNGVAERCVRSLQEWLLLFAWTADAELGALRDQFCRLSNDRPQQGIGIPGLSPNEFAGRIWLF